MRRIKPIAHEEQLPVVDHLDELRSRLIVVGAAFLVTRSRKKDATQAVDPSRAMSTGVRERPSYTRPEELNGLWSEAGLIDDA